MRELSRFELRDCAEAFAFLGNTLLTPMNQTSDIGLDAAFWKSFPAFDANVRQAADDCSSYVAGIAESQESRAAAVQSVSVEFTQLFVGPPKPLAAPWETFYRSKNVKSGFGEPTYEMHQLLREAGLKVSNENNQYADHMGIELLYVSALCDRASKGGDGQDAIGEFLESHVQSWIGDFRKAVGDAVPDGYYIRILALAEALVRYMSA
ncbi:TorD/DmsD family molecular chaperone [Slackia heliotrinireducens]|uniref:TorD/DmsD family molecular chaperone n=1 Tax=Slackia heliotrinireducens TaxID=84110 RepID=UPI003314D1F6